MRLDGKVVVITGAGSGMGKAMALRFAAEGATIVGADIAQDPIEAVAREVKDAGGVMTPLVVDVRKREDVERMVRTAIDDHGALNVLCNNAGVMDSFQGVAALDDATYERVMGVNVYGPMAAMRVAIPHMKEQGGGSIVNTASAASLGGGSAGAAYTASKHALAGLTKNTAVTYAQFNVRCNAIAAGAVATNIQQSMDMSSMDQEAAAVYGKWHPLAPATLQPEDIANLALYLASDEAKLINGAVIPADAGWAAF
jgi:NAD(P)-dependent dehydrogenase (short-subunit alcohol dehydrogenase family)